MSLPSGWRKVCSPDGRIYYQNDTTKQTQWESPSVAGRTIQITVNQPSTTPKQEKLENTLNATTESTSITPALNSTQCEEDDEYQDAGKRMWWHKEHIIWLFLFVLNIYDYITDLQVAISWSNIIPDACPQFNCNVTSQEDNELLTGFIYILLSCSSIGFLVNFIKNIFEAHRLYIAYKYPMNVSDEIEKELRRYRRALYWNWIPLIFEDILSLYLIFMAYLELFRFMQSGQTIYIQSIILSMCSIMVTLILVCRKRIKLSQSEPHIKNKTYKKAIWWHCCWCTIIAIYMVVMFPLISGLVASSTDDATPVIDIQIGNPEENGRCWFYHRDYDHVYRTGGYKGDIIEAPTFVYDNCSGINYDFYAMCSGGRRSKDPLLECEIYWSFNGNNSNCNTNDTSSDYCQFILSPGICEYYTIMDCTNDFAFYDGHPVMWACFDYCNPQF